MARTTQPAKLETLSTAFDAYVRADLAVRMGDMSRDALFELPRSMNRLEEAAVACGMARDHGPLTEWAAERITGWLVAA